MPAHAEGDFKLTGFDESTYQELDGEAKLTTAAISQNLTGGFEGSATSQNLMCYSADGTAIFLGFVRFDGALDGRRGTFVARADGGYDGAEAKTMWTVIDSSGTGELAGLTGTGVSRAGHGSEGTYSLDYELA